MPELPEVETVRRALERLVLGRRVNRILLLRKDYLRTGKKYLGEVRGRKVVSIHRKGKYLALHLSQDWVLLHHLGMSGRLLWVSAETPIETHTHVRISLEEGKYELRQWDPRRFGFMAVIPMDDLETYPPWAQLGADPFRLTSLQFHSFLQGRKRPIKSLLLDQHILAGLGNIYTDESLHRAGIHPARIAGEISRSEAETLLKQIKRVLHESIRAGGTSTNDFRKLDGAPGEFQTRLRVYGREGKSCLNCGKTINRLILGGRSAHYCPGCQE
jgi:formamidopyrimidine-DNA glycosylase